MHLIGTIKLVSYLSTCQPCEAAANGTRVAFFGVSQLNTRRENIWNYESEYHTKLNHTVVTNLRNGKQQREALQSACYSS